MNAGTQPNKVFTMWLILIILIIKVFLITTKSIQLTDHANLNE